MKLPRGTDALVLLAKLIMGFALLITVGMLFLVVLMAITNPILKFMISIVMGLFFIAMMILGIQALRSDE